MDLPTCETCPYWEAEADTEIGTCHRHAPRLVHVQINPGCDPDARLDGLWPVTCTFEWCGEHPDFPQVLASRRGD